MRGPAEQSFQTKGALGLGKIAHSLGELGIKLDTCGRGDRPLKKRLAPVNSLLKLGAEGFQNWHQVVVAAAPQTFAHGDRPVTMCLHYLVAQALKRLDVRENLLSESERLLGRIGERRNVAVFHSMFQLFELGQGYALYLKVKRVVKAEVELCAAASLVFPNWAHVRELADNTQRLAELEKALRHHLTKNRLAIVWAHKERFQKVLEGRTGRVIEVFSPRRWAILRLKTSGCRLSGRC